MTRSVGLQVTAGSVSLGRPCLSVGHSETSVTCDDVTDYILVLAGEALEP